MATVDLLDENGLQTKDADTLTTELEDGLKAIYGSDINLDSNSPDGQQVGIIVQAGLDIRELITGVYNSFNPDNAVGTVLDQRVAINNIERSGGVYTVVPEDVETDRSVSLVGLDDQAEEAEPTGDIYTIQDDAGNEFYLINSATLAAGTTTVNFRAKNIGNIEITSGTITTQKTIVLGVISLTNSSGVLTQGTNQETDSAIKVRRTKSRSNASFGYLNGLQGKLAAIDGVSDAKVYENKTSAIDSDGIPAHGVWCIVKGGTNANIAAVMESTLNPGVNMKGDVTVNLTTPAGISQPYNFDRPTSEDLYIKFNIQTTEDGATFDETTIKEYIADNQTYSIGEYAETSEITELIKTEIDALGGGGVALDVQISNNGSTWVSYLETTAKDYQFTIDTSNITITVLT